MGLFADLFRTPSVDNEWTYEERALPYTDPLDSVIPASLPDEWTANTTSGATVTEDSSIKNGVVYAATTLIADGVAKLKPRAFRLNPDGSKQYAEVPGWVLRPHPDIRRFDFYGQLLVSAILWGDAFARILRRPSDGAIVGMVPLHPSRVSVQWDKDNPLQRVYKLNGKSQKLTSHDIFHMQGPTMPGSAEGMSVIKAARESIGLGLTLEEFGARYFGQGSQAKVVIELPNTTNMDVSKAKDIISTFERFHKGKNNWHRPAIISGGAKLQIISVPPNDAQFLESRDFQAMDIARWFRVPPHRVGIISKSTSWGSGISEENQALLQHTYGPWIIRLEEALTRYTSGGAENGLHIELNTDELTRGRFEEQAATLTNLKEKGVLTRREVRSALGWPDDGLPDSPEPAELPESTVI